nr:cyclin-dependent protein kinase inhibitor SMR3-like [Ipomoea batatas]
MVTSSSSPRNLESEHHEGRLQEGDNNGKVFEKHQQEENRYEVLVSSLKAACPPAPRKPKAVPAKRRGCCHKRVFLDLSDETESLFPPLLLADLGKKIKKIRSS